MNEPKKTTVYRDGTPYLDGYLMTDIKEAIGKEEYERFVQFIRGQTVGLTDEGQELVYSWDYDRFRNHDLDEDEKLD